MIKSTITNVDNSPNIKNGNSRPNANTSLILVKDSNEGVSEDK